MTPMPPTTYYTILQSPIDDLLLVSDGAALTGLQMEQSRPASSTGRPGLAVRGFAIRHNTAAEICPRA
jgi:hypothetical protein